MTTQEITPNDRWTAPSGHTFRIIEVTDDTVTVDLHRLKDGTPATLTNIQEYGTAELHAFEGWRKQ